MKVIVVGAGIGGLTTALRLHQGWTRRGTGDPGRDQPQPPAGLASRSGGALRAYQDDRLAATSEVVVRNRTGGPERVIDEVERRAPEGFSKLEDVIDAAALEAIVTGYAKASGSSQEQVNARDR